MAARKRRHCPTKGRFPSRPDSAAKFQRSEFPLSANFYSHQLAASAVRGAAPWWWRNPCNIRHGSTTMIILLSISGLGAVCRAMFALAVYGCRSSSA